MCARKDAQIIYPGRNEYMLRATQRANCGTSNTYWNQPTSIHVTRSDLYAFNGIGNKIAALPGISNYLSSSSSSSLLNPHYEVFGRTYITWNPTTGQSYFQQFADDAGTLGHLHIIQTANLIVTAVSTAIFSFLIPFLEILNLMGCKTCGKKETAIEEYQKLKYVNTIASLVFKMVKLSAVIVGLIIALTCRSYYNPISENGCSDSAFNGVISDKNSSLWTVIYNNISFLALLVVIKIMDVIVYKNAKRKEKENETKVRPMSPKKRNLKV